MLSVRYGILLALWASACGDDAPPPGPQCGAVQCPSGYTCGQAAGAKTCRSPAGVPMIPHVMLIMMENTSKATLDASTNTPFLHSLPAMGATAADYHGVTHPSLPNYIALTSGQFGGIKCDCSPMGGACSSFNCNIVLGDCGCAQSVLHLGDQLEGAHLNWRNYAEDMGTPCNLTNAGDYAVRHVPFVYYDNVQMNQARCNYHVVDWSQLAGDLAGSMPSFALLTPNTVHDMHDPIAGGAQNLANGDVWLMQQVPMLMASPAYASSLLIIAWDEDDLSGINHPDDPIPFYALGPLVKPGYVVSSHVDHYALLATIEDALGVGRIGNAAHAQPLADMFVP